MDQRPRILFVDDEPHILQGLRRMLHSASREWSMEFVPGAEAALRRIGEQPIDVLVTDMRMPGMDGSQLLEQVRQRWPAVTRIVLSGHSEQEGVIRAVHTAHQYLAKPCDADVLKRALRRSLQLRERIADPALRQLIAGLSHLPTLPDLYVDITRALGDPNCTAKDVGAIVARDVAFSLKLLQIVNSAFFGLPRAVSDPAEAVVLLGVELVRAIVLGAKVLSAAETRLGDSAEVRRLGGRALRTAHLARDCATALELPRSQREEAFLAGLTVDLGRLVLLENRPEHCLRCDALVRGGMAEPDAETAVFGVPREIVSAALLATWGLPDAVVEAVAFAHRPRESVAQTPSPLACVHVARACLDEAARPLDGDCMAALGIADAIERWRATRTG